MIWELLHRSFFCNNPSRNSKDWRGLSHYLWIIFWLGGCWASLNLNERQNQKMRWGLPNVQKQWKLSLGACLVKTISTSVHTFSSKKQEMVKGEVERTFSDWIKDEELLHIIWLTLKDVGWICTRSYKRTIINAFDFIEFPD